MSADHVASRGAISILARSHWAPVAHVPVTGGEPAVCGKTKATAFERDNLVGRHFSPSQPHDFLGNAVLPGGDALEGGLRGAHSTIVSRRGPPAGGGIAAAGRAIRRGPEPATPHDARSDHARPPGGRDGVADFASAALIGTALIPAAILTVAWTPRIVWTVLAGDVGAIPWPVWLAALGAFVMAFAANLRAERRERVLSERVRKITEEIR